MKSGLVLFLSLLFSPSFVYAESFLRLEYELETARYEDWNGDGVDDYRTLHKYDAVLDLNLIDDQSYFDPKTSSWVLNNHQESGYDATTNRYYVAWFTGPSRKADSCTAYDLDSLGRISQKYTIAVVNGSCEVSNTSVPPKWAVKYTYLGNTKHINTKEYFPGINWVDVGGGKVGYQDWTTPLSRHETVYAFSNSGKVLKEITTSAFDGKISVSEINYTYNANDQLTRQEQSSGNSSMVREVKYDSIGDRVEDSSYRIENGTRTGIYFHKKSYYPDTLTVRTEQYFSSSDPTPWSVSFVTYDKDGHYISGESTQSGVTSKTRYEH